MGGQSNDGREELGLEICLLLVQIVPIAGILGARAPQHTKR